MRIHLGEKPYSCDRKDCKKSFRTKGQLKEHSIIHTKLKLFNCHLCRANFGRKGILQKHLMIHTGEKPHECGICGKRFSDKSNMKIHAKRHVSIIY